MLHSRSSFLVKSPLSASNWPRRTSNAVASSIYKRNLPPHLARASRIDGEQYIIAPDDLKTFRESGFVHLPMVLTEEEMVDLIDPVYTKLMNREVEIASRDLCDMSGAVGRTPDQFTVYNVMLPRMYCTEWQESIFEKRCKSIADQLCGGRMAVDYDQILAKRPESPDAEFKWHQDMAYWPPTKADKATATCWLAVDNSTVENGCMRFVAGSHLEPSLRKHAPVGATREESHALYTTVDEAKDTVVYAPIQRGDITVHNEMIVHGSGPNESKGWRRAYVLAFRKEDCIAEERAMGFTHSHNDDASWDAFRDHELLQKRTTSSATAGTS